MRYKLYVAAGYGNAVACGKLRQAYGYGGTQVAPAYYVDVHVSIVLIIGYFDKGN